MGFKIAIHERKGSFSDRWIQYCLENKIPFEKLNCCDNDIIGRVKKFDAILWHWVFHVPKDVLVAKSLIRTFELMNKVVFPCTAACWHYDDKIAQKYLLEALGAPFVPAYIFYCLEDALLWLEQTEFPKVFKLSKGAGSANVRLVESVAEARNLAEMAFGSGIKHSGGYFSDSAKKFKKLKKRGDYLGTFSRLPKALAQARQKMSEYNREKNYIYFQDFIPDNNFDTRITIIGDRAFGFTRNTRQNDFRASGSGSINYDLHRIDQQCIEVAFQYSMALGGQSIAFDFIKVPNGKPVIVEISYCYDSSAVHACPGFWDRGFNWHAGNVWPQDAIIEDILERYVS